MSNCYKLGLLLFFLAGLSCKSPRVTERQASAIPKLLTIEQSQCEFSPCPLYTFTLFANGTAILHGSDFVLYPDTSITIEYSQQTIDNVMNLLDRTHFRSLSSVATHLPLRDSQFVVDNSLKDLWYAPFYEYFQPQRHTTTRKSTYTLWSDTVALTLIDTSHRNLRPSVIATLEDSLEEYLHLTRWIGVYSDNLIIRSAAWDGAVPEQDSLFTLHEALIGTSEADAYAIRDQLRSLYRTKYRFREDTVRAAMRKKYATLTDADFIGLSADSLQRVIDSLGGVWRKKIQLK